GICEIAVNAALALIEAAAPKDEIAAALAVQMACCHTAAMAVLARLGGGHGTERRVVAMATAAARLLRAYAVQVETLRRVQRGPGQVYPNGGGRCSRGRQGYRGSCEGELEMTAHAQTHISAHPSKARLALRRPPLLGRGELAVVWGGARVGA